MSTKRDRTIKDGLQGISEGRGFAGLVQGTTTSTPQEQVPQAEQAPQRAASASAGKYGRLCAVVNIELQRKLQVIAHRNSLTFKQVLEQAMDKAVAAYEAKYGAIELSDGAVDSKDLF